MSNRSDLIGETSKGVDEEKNRKLSSSALRLSRKQQLEAVVIKRKGNFTYLQKVHNGNAYWLNCVLFSKEFIRYYSRSVPTNRIVGYYYLGLGIANILKLAHGLQIVKAFSQVYQTKISVSATHTHTPPPTPL